MTCVGGIHAGCPAATATYSCPHFEMLLPSII
jgi:hypothetical protein